MIFECRAYVRFVAENKHSVVPVEFIKDYKEPFECSDTEIREVFWSNNSDHTPETVKAKTGKLLNIDEEMSKAKTGKEREKLKNAEGYYNAKVLIVKGNNEELTNFLDTREGRRLQTVKGKVGDTGAKSSDVKSKESSSSKPLKRKSNDNLLKSGISYSASRLCGEVNPLKRLRSNLLKGFSGVDSEEDSGDDENLIVESEKQAAVEVVEAKWNEKYSNLKDKYTDLKRRHDKVVEDCDDYRRKYEVVLGELRTTHKVNLRLQTILCDSLEKYNLKISLNTAPSNLDKIPCQVNQNSPVSLEHQKETFSDAGTQKNPTLPTFSPANTSSPINRQQSPTFSPASTSSPINRQQSTSIKPSIKLITVNPDASVDLFQSPVSKTIISKKSPCTARTDSSFSLSSPQVSNSLDTPNSIIDDSESSIVTETSAKKYRTLNAQQLSMASRCRSGTDGDSVFIRNLSEMVFTREVLLKSSVFGIASNANKNAAVKPRLDEDGVAYIRTLFEERVRKENPEVPEEALKTLIKLRTKPMNSLISRKIKDLVNAVNGTGRKKPQEIFRAAPVPKPSTSTSNETETEDAIVSEAQPSLVLVQPEMPDLTS